MYSEEIYKILEFEMKNLLERMESDFKKNYLKKDNNWILTRFSSSIKSNMVFVSSFESKYGNMFENISQDIARLTFGENNVKFTYKGYNVSDEEYEEYTKLLVKKYNSKKNNTSKKKQYIISKISSGNDFGKVIEDNKGDGKKKQLSTLNQEACSNLLNDVNYSNEIIKQEVDLLYFNPNTSKYNIFEIKAGGNLDSSNGPKNIEKMLRIYSSLGKVNSNLYFATLYNKDGEGNEWNGSIKYKLNPDMILIGKNFWDKILPPDISFNNFVEIYYDVFDNLNFDESIDDLIKKIE